MPTNGRSPEETEGFLQSFESQRSQLEAEIRRLQRYRDRYKDLYDSAPVAYTTLDAEGYVQEINLTGARLLNADRDSLTGHPSTDCVAKEDQKAFLDHIRQCVQEHREVTADLALVTREGHSLIKVIFKTRFECSRSRFETDPARAFCAVDGAELGPRAYWQSRACRLDPTGSRPRELLSTP